MAYSETVKNFNRIRDYMREFFVYGFRSRDEYTGKSSRSYDDERRRLESWLGDYMHFRQTPEGKIVFISIDSRILHHNPLYKAWKTKSFTDGDITLHFILMDILEGDDKKLTLGEIIEEVDKYLSAFEEPKSFDESTIRKKLKEYVEEGIIVTSKKGKILYYQRSKDVYAGASDILDFFSEIAPCGVIGSYLLDKKNAHKENAQKEISHKEISHKEISHKEISHKEIFGFKHHYITAALDSEILCDIFTAMRDRRMIKLEMVNRNKYPLAESLVVPLQVMISAQNGRQYLMAYSQRVSRVVSLRIDRILSVTPGEVCDTFEEYRAYFQNMRKHLWGVSVQSRTGERMEHVDFTVRIEKDEPHILQRLEREKRCGILEQIDEETVRFSVDVYDASELIPWIRSFICRIKEVHFSDPGMEEQFHSDIQRIIQRIL